MKGRHFQALMLCGLAGCSFAPPYHVPQIVVYLLRFNLKIAPKLVVISAVKEIHVVNPEDSGTDN